MDLLAVNPSFFFWEPAVTSHHSCIRNRVCLLLQVRRRNQRVRAESLQERGDLHRSHRYLPVQLHRGLHGQRLREAQGGDVRQLALLPGRVHGRVRSGDAAGQQLYVPVSLRLPGPHLRHGNRLLRLPGSVSERRHLHRLSLRACKLIALRRCQMHFIPPPPSPLEQRSLKNLLNF